jgi:hypothetical protein
VIIVGAILGVISMETLPAILGIMNVVTGAIHGIIYLRVFTRILEDKLTKLFVQRFDAGIRIEMEGRFQSPILFLALLFIENAVFLIAQVNTPYTIGTAAAVEEKITIVTFGASFAVKHAVAILDVITFV